MRVNVFMNKIQMFYHLRTQASCYKQCMNCYAVYEHSSIGTAFPVLLALSAGTAHRHFPLTESPCLGGQDSYRLQGSRPRRMERLGWEFPPVTTRYSSMFTVHFHTRRPFSLLVWRSTLMALYCSAQTPLWDARLFLAFSLHWNCSTNSLTCDCAQEAEVGGGQTWADSVSKH